MREKDINGGKISCQIKYKEVYERRRREQKVKIIRKENCYEYEERQIELK